MAKKQHQQHHYPVDVRWSDRDNSWIAEAYDLPGCAAHGDTPEEAIREAQDAIAGWLETAKEEGRELAPPSKFQGAASGNFVLRLPKSLHAQLRNGAEREGVSLNQFVLYLLSQRMAEHQLRGFFERVRSVPRERADDPLAALAELEETRTKGNLALRTKRLLDLDPRHK